MKHFSDLLVLAGFLLPMFAAAPAGAATALVGDTYTVTGSGSGFALNAGVNSGINPPTTRLTGTTAANLRYINTGTKATTAYTITSSKLRVTAAANPGRFVLSADGTTPFDFGPALGVGAATPGNPVVYDINISMDNDSTGTQRFSFALGTTESDAYGWDFGFQVYRVASGNNYYTIGKRIDTGSSGLASDLNAAIYTMGASTYGTEITILMRVTDAGAETSGFNSRVQLSLNGGSTWFYDTDNDADLASTGWRLNGSGRYIMWDVAPDAGNVTFDNFSLSWVSGPRSWTGGGTDGNWSTAANWGGAAPATGDKLVFGGTTRQSNTNNISNLSVPWVTFNNGGFSLYGNTLTNSGAITNLAGVNNVWQNMAWSSTAAKTWSLASGSELVLNNTNTIEVTGDHSLRGGGTLRQKRSMNIGQATTANPAFSIYEGKHIIDGGTFNSRGDYRIGSLASGTGAQTILTNNALLNLTVSAANLRVGDSANPVISRLSLEGATLTMSGGNIAIPYAAGATGEVSQVGGTVSGAIVNFSQAGAGTGTYTVKNATLQPLQIKKTTSGGVAQMNFDNAIVRAASGASNAFMSGLNVAQIQTGGLTVEANADVVIGQALTGAGALTKTGNNKATLTAANTFSGNTLISAGTLAIGVGGSIASPSITVANGTTFDVSAVSGYALTGSQTLVRNSSSGVGAINGSLTLNSGADISLMMDGASGTVGTLSVAGGLNLNGNNIAINVASAPLGLGNYTLISYSGSKSGSFNSIPTLTGSGLGLGLAAEIVESAGQITLRVYTPPRTWTGAGANGNWSIGANWGGVAPTSGDQLIFNGTTRQANTNDIAGLTVPWVTFNNGGFVLYGNAMTNSGAITNLAGNNSIWQNLGWSSTAAKTWSIANGSELSLSGTNYVEVNGDHTLSGGGTLRIKGKMDIGQATSANPAFIINEGNCIVDGSDFKSSGDYRIGGGAQTILTNNATFTLTTSAAALLVGDSANTATTRLLIDNSTLALSGGNLAIQYAAGATSEVFQTGGLVSGAVMNFSQAGAGSGTYTLENGTIEALQIKKIGAGGIAQIYLDNAILRPASGASNAFMSGLDVAEIRSGALTLDAVSDIIISQAFTGSGALTKTGAGKLSLSGANTYAGNTIISAGTLALGVGGSIASPSITIANGTTFDVSALSGYAISGAQTLIRNATSGVGSVNGSVTFNSGSSISLAADGAAGSIGALSVAGNLVLNANSIVIDVSGAPLGLGTYTLISYTGSKTGSFAAPSLIGSGLAIGLAAELVESAGQIALRVYTPPRTWTGAGSNGNWSSGANWNGVAPTSGDWLIFDGTTRQANTNDISGLNTPWITFNNGGFALYGNAVTVSSAITNLSGNNSFVQPLAWSSTTAKYWTIASGSEVQLNNNTSVEVNGDHNLSGGGTLRVKGSMDIGQTTTVTPAFEVDEGKMVIDGGSFTSRGGYRIGSLANAAAGAQTILTNGASFTLTVSAGNVRVGDSANPVTSRLLIDNSTLTMSGGLLCIPYASGSQAEVSQTGGTVSGCRVSFSESGAGTGSYTINGGTLEAVQIRVNNASGSASMYLNNAILRTAPGAYSAFASGLDVAQIQSGGLTLDATSDISIAQAFSGTGALTKIGAGKVTCTGANTYSGNTIISAGTLALGTGGSIANSPFISIAPGTTFDVSALGNYAVAGSQALACSASSGTANVNGSLTFNTGAGLSLKANSGVVGTLSIAGGLTLNSNLITIDVTGAALNSGTYPLISYTGAKSGYFNATPVITGSGLAPARIAKIVESAGQISLMVSSAAHGVAAGLISVVQNDMRNTEDSVTLSTGTCINGFQLHDGHSRGDFFVQIGSDSTDDVYTGVLMTSVAENGRDHNEPSGTNYCTSSMCYSRSGTNAGTYFIPMHNAPDDAEYNINVAAAFFPYDLWLGGYARNSGNTNGGANNLFTGSSGLTLGAHFVDNGNGTSTVNLSSFGINSQTDGVLLVTHGGNEANFAQSKANSNGTWTVYVHNNATNGGVFEQGPVAFVFIPKANTSVISGKFQGDGTRLIYSGSTPQFDVTNVSTGVWRLTIPGRSPAGGVLIVSAEGGMSVNQDNMVSYEPDGDGWLIQSRDLPGTGLQTPSEPVASFVFIPSPAAALVAPTNGKKNVGSSITLKVNLSNAVPGNLTVSFRGHQAPKPYPGKDFAIAVIPDSQVYVMDGHVAEKLYSQCDWIVDNCWTKNIAYVAHLGDQVQNGDILSGSPNEGEWRKCTNGMYRLENPDTTKRMYGIPYGAAVGNHEQEPNDDPDGTTDLYNKYFGTSHFSGRPYYGGHYASNNDSHFDLFSASGLDFIVLYFENGRSGATILDWADAVLATNQNRRVITVIHSTGTPATPSTLYPQGQDVYNALKTNPNFFLMLGGHVDGEGSLVKTYNGVQVHEFISDYQFRGGGGDGFMRMMYFSPSNNTVSIETYSPYLNQYERDADSEMSFSYDMDLPSGNGSLGTAYSTLSTSSGYTNGSQVTYTWSGLSTNKIYEWYVTVTDEAGDTATSPAWRFSTGAFSPNPAPPAPDAFTTWKTTYKIDDANADDDHDGQSNLAEYLANTNPTNAASVFQLLEAKRQANGQVTLSWSSVGGTRYRIQYTDGLGNGFTDVVRAVAEETDPSPRGTASKQTYTDTSATTNSVRYYRVKIVQ